MKAAKARNPWKMVSRKKNSLRFEGPLWVRIGIWEWPSRCTL